MAGQFIGVLILWLIVAVIVVAVAAWLLNRLYHRSTKDVSFVRTGMGGEKVVINGGALVLPIVHEVTPVDMTVHRMRVVRENENALMTRDRVRVEVAGADSVLVPAEHSLEQQVYDANKGLGVDVVFDAVGRDSFDHSIAALRPGGHLVSYGQASGDTGARDIGSFATRSLKLSRPNYGHYIDTREKIMQAADAVWGALKAGTISVNIGKTFTLADAASAHPANESRQTTGSTLLLTSEAQ